MRTGDPVELIGLAAAVKSVVTSVETFGKTMAVAQAGDNAAHARAFGVPPAVLPPHHRRLDYVELVTRALKPGGNFGLVCFRPEGGSGYTDQQVYERASLGGGLGYSKDRLRSLWDEPPFSLRAVRQMAKQDGRGPYYGQDFLWALLATKEPSRLER